MRTLSNHHEKKRNWLPLTKGLKWPRNYFSGQWTLWVSKREGEKGEKIPSLFVWIVSKVTIVIFKCCQCSGQMATLPDQTKREQFWVSVHLPYLKFGLKRSLYVSPKEMVMMSSFHLSRVCQGRLGDNWHSWNPRAPWHKLSIVDITVPRLMDASDPHYITLLGWKRRHLTLTPLPTVQIKTSRGENECFFNHMTSVCTKPFKRRPTNGLLMNRQREQPSTVSRTNRPPAQMEM